MIRRINMIFHSFISLSSKNWFKSTYYLKYSSNYQLHCLEFFMVCNFLLNIICNITIFWESPFINSYSWKIIQIESFIQRKSIKNFTIRKQGRFNNNYFKMSRLETTLIWRWELKNWTRVWQILNLT